MLQEARKNALEYEEVVAQKEEKKKQVYQLAESGAYSAEVVKERLAAIDAEVITVKIERNEQHIDYLEAKFEKEYFQQALCDISRLWLDLSPTYRLRFQKLVFPSGISYTKKSGFGTAHLGCIFNLYLESDGADLSKVDPTGFEPATSSVQMRRSSQLSYGPTLETTIVL